MVALLAFGLGSVETAMAVSKDGTTTTAVHEAGGSGVVLNSSDYYGSGNDDAFAEYGITTFNFTLADFGGTLSGIDSVVLTLTVNDRTFADGDMVELFFTPDTEADLGGGFADLSYNATFVNGIDGSQYVTAPVSLGAFAITEMAGRPGGETDMFTLDFTGAALTALLNSITNGSDFQIIVGATNSTHDITYSGVGNTFDPGDPSLEITPSTVAVEAQPWSAIKALYR
jgi:hypothetical protein